MFKLFNALKNRYFFGGFVYMLILVSCNKESQITFEDFLISKDDNAVIEVNIPKAKGQKVIAETINTTLNAFAILALDATSSSKQKTINEAVKQFDDEFKKFNAQIPEQLSEELPIWEAIIDGEITYKSDDLVCIAMNSSVNTGAAKNRSQFAFFNFDLSSGKQLKTSDLIENEPEFTRLVKKYFDKELLTNYNDASDVKSMITDSNFKLPTNLGFNDEGIVVLFDNFEIPMENPIEFTISFEAAKNFLRY